MDRTAELDLVIVGGGPRLRHRRGRRPFRLL